MSASYPINESFLMDDEEHGSNAGFYNPYYNGYNGNEQTLEKTTLSPNPTSQNNPNANSNVNPLPTNNQFQQSNIDHIHDQHIHHTHDGRKHRHHHHHHHHHADEHIHDHHIHQHEHPPPEPEQPPHVHEQPPHVHEHIHREHTHHHHHHEHNHDHHQHDHDHEHHHHNHDHDHHQHEHNQHEYNQHSDIASALTIRRHYPGSTDPSLHSYQAILPLSPDYMYPRPPNVPVQSNINVTIRRNIAQADHTIIQPVLYPVAVFTNSPAPQPVKEVPRARTPKLPPAKPPTPKPLTPVPRLPLRTSPIPPISPAKPSPIPPKPQMKRPPPPPISPIRLERESPPLPTRKRSILVRKPIRTDVVTSTVRRVVKHSPIPPTPRSTRVVVQQPVNYTQHYRRPAVYSVPKRAVSYRTVPGLTTRELENDEMDDSGAPIYVKTPRVQTVTYRT